jgi:hypothetical protein
MSSEEWPRILLLALALVLPLAALRRRGLLISQFWGMAAIWVGLFLVIAAIFGYVRG